MNTISVLIVNYNGESYLSDLFTSLAEQSMPPDEVIMVDNDSSDNSVPHTQANFPWVTLVESDKNLGFAAGNNLAFSHSSGEFIALLNNDTTVDPDWLCNLQRPMQSDNSIAITVPKIYIANRNDVINCAGADFNNMGFCWGRGSNERDVGQYETLREVAATTGCSMMIRRKAMNGMTLFDESLFMYYEELELSLRIRGRGFSIVYVPDAIIFHRSSESVRTTSGQPLLFQQFYGNRNRVKILLKYFPTSVLMRNLPLILLSLFYWNTFFLLHGGVRFFIRALAAQSKYAWMGLTERKDVVELQANLWLEWMKKHGLWEIIQLGSKFHGSVK